MLYIFIVFFILIAIIISFSHIFSSGTKSIPYVSKETLLLLLLIYSTLLLSFGLLYTVLHFEGHQVLLKEGKPLMAVIFPFFFNRFTLVPSPF